MLYSFEQNQKLAWELSFSISDIAQDVYQLIYSKPYEIGRFAGSERVIHGMGHISRATLFGAAGYNLMTMAGVEGLDKLDEQTKSEEIKLVQVALMLHDSGAEGDGKDIHDSDSAINLYEYLTQRMGCPPDKASMVTSGMLNKDWKPGLPYYELELDTSGAVSIKKHKKTDVNPFSQEINRMRLAINFGDSLDSNRTGNEFDSQYLLLLNQDYSKEQQAIIQQMTLKLFNENLDMCLSFEKAYHHQRNPKCNNEEAFQYASVDMKDKAHYLNYFFHGGDSAKLDPNWIPNLERQPDASGYLMKNVADHGNWPNFLHHLIDHENEELRLGGSHRHLPYTFRQVYNPASNTYDPQIIPSDKNDPLRGSLWTAEQKAQTTRAQSMSYYDEDYVISAHKGLSGAQVGIQVPVSDALIQRIYPFNLSSYRRSYTGYKARDLLEKERKDAVKSFNDLKKIELSGNPNEIMARIRWDETNDQYKIMLFDDTPQSKIVAVLRAIDLAEAIRVRREREGKPKLDSYRPKIMFYPSLTEYTLEEQQQDIDTIFPPRLKEGLSALNGEKNITIEQKIQFLHAIGPNYSRHMYMLILNKIRENPSEYQTHLHEIIKGLPKELIAYILKNPTDPMYADMFNVVFENAASVGSFISTVQEWKEIVKFPAVQERFKVFFQDNSSIDQFKFLFIRDLIALMPFIDPNKKDKTGLSALDRAFNENKSSSVNFLLKRGGQLEFLGNVNNKLSIALEIGNMDFAKTCVNANTVNSLNSEGNTPLHIAVEKDDQKMFALLLKNGADINLPNKEGSTVLHRAIEIRSDLIDLIISQNPKVNTQDNEGITPLHSACQRNDEKTIEILIKNGADVNAIDLKGKTPLFYALDGRNDRVAMTLIKINPETLQSLPLDLVVDWQRFPAEYLLELLPYFEKTFFKKIFSTYEHVTNMLKKTPDEETRRAFIDSIGIEHIVGLLTDTSSLTHIVRLIPESYYPELAIFLKNKSLQYQENPYSPGFEYFIKSFPSELRLSVLACIGREQLEQALCYQLDALEKILDALPEVDRLPFLLSLDNEFLRKQIKFAFQFKAMLRKLPEFKHSLIALLGIEHLKKIFKDDFAYNINLTCVELSLTLAELPVGSWKDFLTCLGPKEIDSLLIDGKYLFVMLSKLKQNDRPELMSILTEVIGEDKVNQLTTDVNTQSMIAGLLEQQKSTEDLKVPPKVNL